MAEKKLEPILKLTPEVRKRMEGLAEDIKRAEHGVEVMKELGMDTKILEGRIAWAKKARTIMLREFE